MKSRNCIVRTIKATNVTILDAVTGEELKKYPVSRKTTKQAEMIKYMKSTGNGAIRCEIEEIEEQRGEPLASFIANSFPIKDGELVGYVEDEDEKTEA